MENAVLNPGDAVRITVWRKPELSGEFQVGADGSVADPFYMEVHVAGVPFPIAAGRVRAHIERYEAEPRVLVEPLFRVAVGGEVRRPDLYSFRPETTISQAIMLAGGVTDRGHPDHAWLHRGGQRLRVDINGSAGGLAQSSIRSGDHIVVERRQSIFRDYVLPAIGVVGAVASVARLIVRW